jgi:hypothetical protein
MVYDMQKWYGSLILVIIFFVCSSGCLSTQSEKSAALPEPIPTLLPTPESKISTISPSAMALQLTDIPSDYILKDRSVMVFPEVTQLTRDLGWRQGYFVSFYRINKEKDDQTGIRQSINIFPIENMNKVFSIEKEDMKSRADRSGTIYEIPFPTIGDASIAFRGTDANDPDNFVVYSVLFTKKNVFEKITMKGTSTDYEVLKDIAQTAAEKIR